MARRLPTTPESHLRRARNDWAKAAKSMQSARFWKDAAAKEREWAATHPDRDPADVAEGIRIRLERMESALLLAKCFRSSAKYHRTAARDLRARAKADKAAYARRCALWAPATSI